MQGVSFPVRHPGARCRVWHPDGRRSAILLLLLFLCCPAARADYEYRYVEGEKHAATQGSGLRKEGFTSWMRHPSAGELMVLFNGGWLEYDVKDLGPGPYHLFVRGLAFAKGAEVDLFWDGQLVGRPSYAVPSTALKWSREVGTVRGPGDHKLRVVAPADITQAPYLDVFLLTTQSGYQPDNADEDFRSYTTPLPILHLGQGPAARLVPPLAPADGAPADAGVAVAEIKAEAPGIGRNALTLSLRNAGNAARRLSVAARLGESKEVREPVLVPAGGEAAVPAGYLSEAAGSALLSIRLLEGEREVLAGAYRVTVPDPVAVSLDEVAFPVGTPEAKWRAAFTCRPEVAKEIEVEVLFTRAADGKVLERRRLKGAAPAVATAFPIAKLAAGRYRVSARFQRAGTRVFTDEREVFLFRPVPLDPWEPVRRSEARGDTLFMNGKPFMGRLLYHAAPDAHTRDHGFNLVQCFGSDPDPRESIGKHLDSCAKAGVWGAVALFNNRYLLPGDHFDLGHLREVVLRYKDHPALWGWDLIDEPESTVTPERVAEAARLIRELDPNHIVWVNLCGPNRATDYLESQDLWSFDFYPLPTLPPFSYMQWLKISDEKLRGRRPIGSVLQTYAYNGGRMPTPDELRCICYLHLIHDHKWLGFYSYYDAEPDLCLARDPVLWSYTRALNNELRALAPAWLDAAPFRTVEASLANDVFQAAIKEVGGKRYLVAVYGGKEPVRVRMKVAGRTAKVLLEEERAVPIKESALEDDFRPCGVHVYEIGE